MVRHTADVLRGYLDWTDDVLQLQSIVLETFDTYRLSSGAVFSDQLSDYQKRYVLIITFIN